MVAIFVLAASALVAVPAVLAGPDTTINNLMARQLTGFDPSKIPTSCLTTQCQDFANKVSSQNCTTLQCLCSADIINAIKACEQCAIDAGGVTQADINTAMQAFAQDCSAAGFPISGATTGGSSGSSSAAGGTSATGTKTASGSASTATSAGTSSGTTGGSSSSPSGVTGTKSGASMLSAGVLGSFAALALGVLNL